MSKGGVSRCESHLLISGDALITLRQRARQEGREQRVHVPDLHRRQRDAKVSTFFCWPPIFDVVGSEKYRRPAPLSPAAMARLVARKRFTSKKGDLPMVIALNTRTILSIFRDMKELVYNNVGWGDDEAVQLAEVLPLCTSATALSLQLNEISDRGAKALAAAFAEGAMPELEELFLHDNQIGDEGAKALAEAVGKGALPELKKLNLMGNKLSQTAKDAWEAVKAKRSGLSVVL